MVQPAPAPPSGERVFVFADCGVVPEPTPAQLAYDYAAARGGIDISV